MPQQGKIKWTSHTIINQATRLLLCGPVVRDEIVLNNWARHELADTIMVA